MNGSVVPAAAGEGTTASARCEPGAIPLLTSPPFLLAVALLLLNDHVLKAAFGNWLTGKLSDFAGLFAFALFWTALFPARRRAVFAATALGFVFWKSPLSEPALAVWNALGMLPLARVVDASDGIALVALAPAYRLARRPQSAAVASGPRLRRRAAAVASAGVALFAFTATSIAPPVYPIPQSAEYVLSATRGEIRLGLNDLHLNTIYLPEAAPVRRRAETAADTLVVYLRHPPEQPIAMRIEVHEEPPGTSTFRLLTVSVHGPEPTPESVHRAFREQLFEPLRDWMARHRESGS